MSQPGDSIYSREMEGGDADRVTLWRARFRTRVKLEMKLERNLAPQKRGRKPKVKATAATAYEIGSRLVEDVKIG